MSNQPFAPYGLYLQILHDICHEVPCIRDQLDVDKLIEWGWVKRKEMAVDYEPMFSGDVRCDCYVLTAKGHLVLSPRDCRISRHNAPNFDFSHKKGLHLCWGKFKRTRHTRRSVDPGLMAVAWAIGCLRPYSFAPSISSDGHKLWESAS